jgi:rSAM/selenodomain-associated transferase 2
MTAISVVIPALNAAPAIGRTLAAVKAPGLVTERIVVDGGSTDGTPAAARAAGARVIAAERGRGSQLAAGAAVAVGDWLLFLHADTVPEPGWADEARAFTDSACDGERAAVFTFALDDDGAAAARLAAMVAWRCRALALPYGDQGLLIGRRFYDGLGGFRKLPLYEDVDIVRRIGRARLTVLESRAVTSAARYRRGGYLVRPARNLACLALYFAGVSPRVIARLYG